MATKPTESPVEERTNLAAERTRLAKERTFAAWVRTALAAVGIGIALAKLLPSAEDKLLVQIVGILFMATGILIFVYGLISYRDVVKGMESHIRVVIPHWVTVTLTVVLVLGSVIGLVSIVLDL